MKTSPELQIQRLNHIIHKIESFGSLDFENLSTKPGPNQWSLIEIIDHLNLSYALYRPRIDALLSKLPDRKALNESYASKGLKGWLIASYKPKNNKRSFKMKTFANLEPVVDATKLDSNKQRLIFEAFFNHMDHLKKAIIASRSKDCSKGKLDSALGSILRFTLPEAIEFNLNHMDRHLIQLEETWSAVKI
jgi:hypothetical protein